MMESITLYDLKMTAITESNGADIIGKLNEQGVVLEGTQEFDTHAKIIISVEGKLSRSAFNASPFADANKRFKVTIEEVK